MVGQGPGADRRHRVLPRGKASNDPVFAGWFTLNGNGEMTGTTWIEESGFLEGPIGITNTHSVGVVRDAILEWQVEASGASAVGAARRRRDLRRRPQRHQRLSREDRARRSPRSTARRRAGAAKGNVGGGTGMICHGFKGGIGTASRVLPKAHGGYTVGVLVQCNYGTAQRAAHRRRAGRRGDSRSDAVHARSTTRRSASTRRRCTRRRRRRRDDAGAGSIIIVVATDAPLLPHQLKRVATRASLGVGRMGGNGENCSGDIFIAFSTANPGVGRAEGRRRAWTMLPNERINPLFDATVQATEEAILNAMVAAETMTGADGLRVFALPHDRLMAAMRKYGRAK